MEKGLLLVGSLNEAFSKLENRSPEHFTEFVRGEKTTFELSISIHLTTYKFKYEDSVKIIVSVPE